MLEVGPYLADVYQRINSGSENLGFGLDDTIFAVTPLQQLVSIRIAELSLSRLKKKSYPVPFR